VYLFGDGTTRLYQVLFLAFTFLGSIVTATNVLNFGDYMILGMAFPNLLGVLLLSGKIRKDLDSYWGMYKKGEFPIFK
jgi:AGCS family alanine or glycine:cation symporter